MTGSSVLTDYFLSPISEEMKAVDACIDRRLTTGSDIIDSAAGHLFKSGGKRIRAALVLLFSRICGAEQRDKAVEMAASMEIVHAASLIHDDIIDSASRRRGLLSVPAMFGPKVAVLTGDYMFISSVLHGEDGDISYLPVMLKGVSDMVQGELMQLEGSEDGSIEEEVYFRIVEKKTASFMSVCSELGAMAAGGSEDDIKSAAAYGRSLGIAYQIIDDVIDVAGSPALSGKNSGNDYFERKYTLPFIRLIQKTGGAGSPYIRALRKRTVRGWKIIQRAIEELDIVNDCRSEAEEYIGRARGELHNFEESVFRDSADKLAVHILDRKN